MTAEEVAAVAEMQPSGRKVEEKALCTAQARKGARNSTQGGGRNGGGYTRHGYGGRRDSARSQRAGTTPSETRPGRPGRPDPAVGGQRTGS
jgi:hypothetical protein